MRSLRLCVTGAEKAPPELFKMVADLGKPDIVCEGYGITECGPILSANRMGMAHKGVGQAIPGVDLTIVHPETYAPMPTGAEGLILARGPNVFTGYLNNDIISPFVTIKGKSWYKTGDLGNLDETGHLVISGRLKRFIKIGGEMISLGALEEALMKRAIKEECCSANEESPVLAICAKEIEGERTKITLFTRFKVSLEEANHWLRDAGFSNLVRLTHVVQLDLIPLMGTGKVNYRELTSQYLS